MRSSRLQVQMLEPEAQVSDRYKTTNYSLNEFLESTIEDWQAIGWFRVWPSRR